MKKGLLIGCFILFLLLLQCLTIPCQLSQKPQQQETSTTIRQDYASDWNIHKTTCEQQTAHVAVQNQDKRPQNNGAVTGDVMDSPWPMFSHDLNHTGRSPYTTANNKGVELWQVHGKKDGEIWSSAAIDNNNTIYFGTQGSDASLYALDLNGTVKWRFRADGLVWCTPAIANDGTLYISTWGNHGYLQSINPDGTLHWSFGNYYDSTSSPAIGNDGTIYFGSDDHNVYAVHPNGTMKWQFQTDFIVQSSPAIAPDGTIYIGSCDYHLYAINPNGTLRWMFSTYGEAKGSPTIAPDGTIYIPSFNGYLYAVNPNGTKKWQATTGDSVAGAGVALAADGTVYCGTEQLRAYYPNNGTVKWCTNLNGSIYGTVPAVSADGTIYATAGSTLAAVNPDGSIKWKASISNEQSHSSPIIGPNDRVYVGTVYRDYGYLHAFGVGPVRAEADGPYNGSMTVPLNFYGQGYGGTPPYTYHWDFDDGTTASEQNPTHTYMHGGNYTATLTVTDAVNNHSSDTTKVTIGYPLPKITIVKPNNGLYLFNLRLCNFPYPLAIGPITIQVDVTQVDIGISRVEFYYDGQLVRTDHIPPYKWTCFRVSLSPEHDIRIRAIDQRGNQNVVDYIISKIL